MQKISLTHVVLFEVLVGVGLGLLFSIMPGLDGWIGAVFSGVAVLAIVTGLVGSIRKSNARGVVVSLEALVGICAVALVLSRDNGPFGIGAIVMIPMLTATASAMLLTSSIWGMATKLNGGEKGVGFDLLFFLIGIGALFLTFQFSNLF